MVVSVWLQATAASTALFKHSAAALQLGLYARIAHLEPSFTAAS